MRKDKKQTKTATISAVDQYHGGDFRTENRCYCGRYDEMKDDLLDREFVSFTVCGLECTHNVRVTRLGLLLLVGIVLEMVQTAKPSECTEFSQGILQTLKIPSKICYTV